jgi:hypothetical protein
VTTSGPLQPHHAGHRHQPADPPLTWAQAVVTVAATLGLFLLGGVVCAVVWAAVVEPPTYSANPPVFAGQPVPNGEGLERTFNIEATFLLTAGTAAVVLGALAGIAFRANGVVTVLAVLAGSVAGYVTMRYLGTGLGPEALAAQARGAGAHATLLEPLRIHATGVYFAWPIGALSGVMAALWAFAPEPSVAGDTTRPISDRA